MTSPDTTGDFTTLPWDAESSTDAAVTSPSDTGLTGAIRASAGKLAVLREVVAQRTADVKAKREAFEATISDELALLEGAKRAVEAEESALRGMALVHHETTGEAKPCGGVSVVMTKRYDIDEAAGLEWARVHRMCLLPERLDTKAAQKMASVTALPFVTVTEEPSVRLATDLAKALGES